MKKYLLSLCILSTFINPIVSQTQWVKYTGNPVLQKGPDLWDIIGIGQPTVLFENDTVKIWYVGVGNDMKARICYPYSIDGITWTKHNSPVMDVGGAGVWDRGWLDTPEIVRDSTGYKLYYYGDSAWQFSAVSSAMGVAHSPDGINWTKDVNNPIFTKGNAGDWDGTWVESPAVVYDNNSTVPYKMWYNGMDTATWKDQIGLATSLNGVSWVKHTGNPVLATGNWGSYDDMWAGTPAVLFDGNIFEMWYSSTAAASYNVNTSAFDTVGICYATSTDGISWIKHPLNPLFHTFTAPYDSLLDSKGPWAADVIYNPNTQTYMMWFEANGGFMLATAPKNNVSIQNSVPNHYFDIYPNPATIAATIEFNNKSISSATINIYSISGKKLKEMAVQCDKKTEIDISDYCAGIYLIELKSINNDKYYKKLVIY